MKKTFNSVEELLGGCDSSTLKSYVSSLLRNNTSMEWGLVSCSVDGDTYRSEFTAPIEDTDLMHCLTCEITPRGERRRFTICRAATNRHGARGKI